MSDPTLPPARMRFSYASRCRVVQAVLDGATPAARSAAFRLSAASHMYVVTTPRGAAPIGGKSAVAV